MPRFRYAIVHRAGRYAIVRVLASGEAAGYDPVADVEQQQVHFKIHADTAHASAIDAAFADRLTRKYNSLDAALESAEEAGRDCEILS